MGNYGFYGFTNMPIAAAARNYIYDPVDISTASSIDDEFSDRPGQSGILSGLASKWQKNGFGTPSWLTWDQAVYPDSLFIDLPTGQSTIQHLYQPVPSGDFTVLAVVDITSVTARQMWFLNILSTSGDGVGVGYDFGQPIFMRLISGWEQTSTTSALGFSSAYQQWTFQLRKEDTTYYASVSDNMTRLVLPDITSLTDSFTPAYVTFGRVYGSGGATLGLDTFRVFKE